MTEFSSLTPVELAVFAAGEPVIVLGNAFDEQTVADLIETYLAANPPTAADATASIKGVVQLAGDLGGTAAAPTVPGLAGKANTSHTHAEGDVTGLTASLAGKAPTAHSHAQSDVTGLTAALSGKAATSHTHAESDVTGLTAALAGKSATGHTHPQSDVTNLTADLAAKAPLASPAFTGTPTGITKTHVGLGNVDNTADVNKPVSTAQQTALDGKAATSHTHTASAVTDFNTAADARVVAGITGKLDTSAAPELIRDTIATALVAGTNVTITPNDAGDTIEIAASGGGGGGITTEDARDAVAAMLAVTGNATGTNNDAGDTYTINVPGNPLYIQSGTPTPTAPALWVKDLGSGAFSLHIVTP